MDDCFARYITLSVYVAGPSDVMRLRSKIGIAFAVVVVSAMTAKWIFFPSIKDSYFTMNRQMLRRVPSGLVAVRPTHFPKTARKGIISDSVTTGSKPVRRMMGRNVTFQQLIAAAYGQTPERVVLPAGVPVTNFDFLVTGRGDLQQSLQTAIRRQLGYTAQVESQKTESLAFKIINTNLPALTISAAADSSSKFNNGRYYFTHMRPGMFEGWFEQIFKLPVTDRTSLTNFYDFSMDWSLQTQRELNDEQTSPMAMKKIVNDWGMDLVPDTDPVEMLVVKKAL
jgi:uncharacterized protein (TIGR03435 family)